MSLQPQPYPYPAASILDQEVAQHVSVGWAVESRTETMAVLVSPANTNHVLHLLLTLVSCGIWAVVWFALAVTRRTRRLSLVANPDGSISRSQH